MLSDEQQRALDQRRAEGTIDSADWRAAALLGLDEAREDLGGRWVAVEPGETERLLVAHMLGLPLPFASDVEVWVADSDLDASTKEPYRIHQGRPSGLVPALLTQLRRTARPFESEADQEAEITGFYDASTVVVDDGGWLDAWEEAEEAGEEPTLTHPITLFVPHEVVWLWFDLRAASVEGGEEICDDLAVPDEVRARVRFALVKTNHNGDPLFGYLVCDTAGSE